MFKMISPERILKSLNSTSASGRNLIPEQIDPYIAEVALAKNPLRALIPRRKWNSGTYDQNVRSTIGDGRHVGDGMTVKSSTSTITRNTERLKIMQALGGVSGYEQEASKEHIDALRMESRGHTVGISQEEEFAMIYGNAKADDYLQNGFDKWIETNITQTPGVATSFKHLDAMIDAITDREGIPGFFTMSTAMLSSLGRIHFATQRFLDKVEIEGGIKLLSYRDIPIYATSFIGSDRAWTGSTVTATKIAGGSLADNTYFYKVSAVLRSGETLPCTEVNATTETTNNSVKLVWSAPAVANSVRLYKIYRSTTTNTETLLTVIPGVAYSAAGDILNTMNMADVIEFRDLGVAGSMVVSYADQRVTGYNYVPAGAKASEKVLGAGESDIYLISTSAPGIDDGEYGDACAMRVLKEFGYMPLAKISDVDNFLIVGYEALTMVEQFSAKVRGAKLAD